MFYSSNSCFLSLFFDTFIKCKTKFFLNHLPVFPARWCNTIPVIIFKIQFSSCKCLFKLNLCSACFMLVIHHLNTGGTGIIILMKVALSQSPWQLMMGQGWTLPQRTSCGTSCSHSIPWNNCKPSPNIGASSTKCYDRWINLLYLAFQACLIIAAIKITLK